MMDLRSFEEFLSKGFVKRQTPDKERAESLIKESDSRKDFFDKILEKITFSEVDPNYIVESVYDILIELVRARMLLDGFNSKNSHEAEVAYMGKLGFSDADVRFMNQLRYFRNGIKYYGKKFEQSYSKKVMEFMKRAHPELKKLLSR